MKKVIVIVVIAAVLAVGGIVSIVGIGTPSKGMDGIGMDKAREIAVAVSKVNDADIERYHVELDNKNGREYYDIEFYVNGQEYSFDIDAATGAVLKADTPGSAVPSVSQAASDKQSEGETRQQTQQSQQTQQQSAQNQPVQQSQQSEQVQQAPQTTQPTQSAQQEPQTTQQTQQEPQTTQPAQSSTPVQTKISESQAKQSVLDRVPGASMSNFHEFHLDLDDGRYEYEGELYYNGMEYSFEIDAYSGSFRDWDVEPIDD